MDPIINAGAIASPQRWNRYAYALNNPLRFTDPGGLDASDEGDVAIPIPPCSEICQGFDEWADDYIRQWEYWWARCGDCHEEAGGGGPAGPYSLSYAPDDQVQVVTGAEAGGAVGTLILPGAGTLVGGVVGAGIGLWVGWEAGGALAEWYFSKPPADAYDPIGPKAPGKPPFSLGFRDPRGGEQWGKTEDGQRGWLSDKGEVWVPTGCGKAPHGGPHWDVIKGREHRNVYPPVVPKRSGG